VDEDHEKGAEYIYETFPKMITFGYLKDRIDETRNGVRGVRSTNDRAGPEMLGSADGFHVKRIEKERRRG